MKTAIPCLCNLLNTSILSLLVCGSKFPVGSSAMINSGVFNKALAIAVLCCSPPESSNGYFFSISNNPTSFKTSLILANGNLFHKNFKEWSIDLDVTSQRLLVFNKTKNLESRFYGKGFLNGKASFEGPFKSLNLSVSSFI